MAGAIVLIVGDIRELTTETAQLSPGCVFVNLTAEQSLKRDHMILVEHR